MQSPNLNNTQSEAVVSLPVPVDEMSGIFSSEPAYGIGETPLAVLLPTRLRPHSRTKKLVVYRKPTPRKFCGWCRWCEAPLHSKTKPRKDCGDACRKQFERHGCTKEAWEAYKALTTVEKVEEFREEWRGEYRKKFVAWVKEDREEQTAQLKTTLPAIDLHGEGQTATTPRPVTHQVNENDRPEVKEPTPTITGWERGAVVHKARRTTGRLQYDRLNVKVVR